MGKPKSGSSENTFKKKLEENQIIVICGAIVLIFTTITVALGGVKETLGFLNSIFNIHEIEKKTNNVAKNLGEYELEQGRIKESIDDLKESDKKLSNDINQLRDKFMDTLIKKAYRIESKTFMDKVEALYRDFAPKGAIPLEVDFGPPIPQWDINFGNLKEKYENLKKEYGQFLEKHPEENKKLDKTFEALEHRYKKLKEEGDYFPLVKEPKKEKK